MGSWIQKKNNNNILLKNSAMNTVVNLSLTSLSCSGSLGRRFMMSLSADSYASEMAGTMSVPRSIQRIVMVPSGSGTSAIMNSRNGEISGMLLVRVYAIDFLRLSKISRPTTCERHEN